MRIKVVRSAVLDAPIDRVWAILRDFNSHHQWHPAVDASQMENNLDGDVVGGVRRFSLSDGAELREQLLRHDDRDHSFTYCILDSPLPLFDYVATIRLKPVTDGQQTFWEWRGQFRAPADRAAELEGLVGRQIYEAGFSGLRTFLFEQTAAPSRRSVPEVSALTLPAGEALSSTAMVATAAGDPEVLQPLDQSVPLPGPHQVRVRQRVAAVNFLDLKHRRGTAAGLDLPDVLGFEGVGQVIDVGERVNGLFPGDRVAYLSRKPGAYTQIRCVDDAACIPLPEGVSDIDASTLLKGLTAGLLLGRICQAHPGATLLIQSVAGGLGHLLAQWARSMDMTVIGTVSSVDKAKFSRDHGCDHPIVVTDSDRLAADIRRLTNGRGVDYWIHSSGIEGLGTALDCLTRHGHCAVVGDREGRSMPLDLNLLMKRSLTLSAPVIFDYIEDRSYLQRLSHQLFTKIQNGSLLPVIETHPLSEAAAAHARIESRLTTGAVALEI
jgi:NADPH:quinone reductase-like Zn-dependent oxidoreductase